jgi:hypothetical protein
VIKRGERIERKRDFAPNGVKLTPSDVNQFFANSISFPSNPLIGLITTPRTSFIKKL